MFNPDPVIETIDVDGRPLCYVIDNALTEPERWVDYAAAHASEFVDSARHAYPGPELVLPEALSTQLNDFFAGKIRRLFDARRTLGMTSRLSMTTRTAQQLEPRQWQCHVDRLRSEPGQCVVASVLYLFHDETLGGTGFYRPLRPQQELADMVQDSVRLPPEEFSRRHRVSPGYMTQSNAFFARIGAVSARWNRLIFYSGTTYHSGDIVHPERLAADPRTGRLTANGFFLCRRNLA